MNEERKVVGIHGAAVSQTLEHDDNCIKFLEEALERARSGETLGVGIVEYNRDQTVAFSAGGTYRRRPMIGGAEAMKFFWLTRGADA